ncbi:MAG: hypothetical protein ACL93V_01155 [Candidatus Electrothrix sp. YB6]
MHSIREQLLGSISSGFFLEVACRVYLENHDKKESVGQEVADLHNAGKIDAIAEFRKLKSSDQQHDFFMTRHVLEHALPSIESPVAAVMDCVKHLVEEAGNNMAAGTLIPPFIDFCEADAGRPDEVLSAALNEVDDTFDFITPAITAGSNLQLEQYANKAVELCSHENILIRSRAVHALGRIKYHDREELISKSLQAIQTTLEQDCDEYLYAAILRSTVALYKADNSTEKHAIKLLQHILPQQDDIVLYEAAQCLFSKLPASMVDLLLNTLAQINIQRINIIRDIDFGLCSLIKHGMREKVLLFLEKLLVQREQEFSIRQFDTLNLAICNNKEGYLDFLITRWLLSKQVALGRAAADLLENTSEYGTPVAVDLDQLQELPEGIRVFLVRKACGWFFHKPISATSFIVSLIDTASGDEIEEITDILFHPLLINYSGCVKDYLVKTVEEEPSEKVKLVIDTVLEQLKNYHESLNSSISELQPTQAQREVFHRYQSRLFAESYKVAQENSIFNLITTKMCILYGTRSVYYIHHGPGDQKSRQEMALAEHSHYFELPSLERIDPHGLDYTLYVFRVEGCDS